MTDTFEFTLDNPLTDEQWDMIEDVDFDRTDRILFHTKHGKEVEFIKVRHGKWLYGESESGHDGYYCSQCGKHIRWIYGEEDINFIRLYKYCPNCGARMDAERKEE